MDALAEMVEHRRRREAEALGDSRREQKQAQMHVQHEHQGHDHRVEAGPARNQSKPKSQRDGQTNKNRRDTASKYSQKLSDRSWK